MRVAPVNPARARSAARMPFIAALPGWRCLLIAPSALNSHNAAACVPALPSASSISSAVSFSSDPAAAAAPNVATVPVGWKKK